MRRHISIKVEFSDIDREDVAIVDFDTRSGTASISGLLSSIEVAFLAAIMAEAEGPTRGLPADRAAAERQHDRAVERFQRAARASGG